MKTCLICNECGKNTFTPYYIENLKCFWCGSTDVGIHDGN